MEKYYNIAYIIILIIALVSLFFSLKYNEAITKNFPNIHIMKVMSLPSTYVVEDDAVPEKLIIFLKYIKISNRIFCSCLVIAVLLNVFTTYHMNIKRDKIMQETIASYENMKELEKLIKQ